jgi:hypothetical protein
MRGGRNLMQLDPEVLVSPTLMLVQGVRLAKTGLETEAEESPAIPQVIDMWDPLLQVHRIFICPLTQILMTIGWAIDLGLDIKPLRDIVILILMEIATLLLTRLLLLRVIILALRILLPLCLLSSSMLDTMELSHPLLPLLHIHRMDNIRIRIPISIHHRILQPQLLIRAPILLTLLPTLLCILLRPRHH